MASETESGTLEVEDGTGLFWRRCKVPESVAEVLFVHGIGEHSERYAGLAARLAAGGIGSWAFDHRGHGKSGGRRGHVDRWSRYLLDVERIRALVTSSDERPLFIFGHSMGALVCLSLALEGYARRGDVAGWILSGASLRPTSLAKPHLVAIARLLSRITPWIALDLGIASSSLSHDPEVVRRYDEDPAIVRRVTVRWGSEVLKALTSILEGAPRITDPTLILHGGADPLTEADGSRWLHETVSGESELIVYEGALHEPHNDPEHADVGRDVTRWIRARSAHAP